MLPEGPVAWKYVILTALVLLATLFLKVFLSKVKQIVNTIIKRWFAHACVSMTWSYNSAMHSRKKELFSSLEEHMSQLDGDLLELGAGTGANFHFYPQGCSVIVVEPNEYMNKYLLDCKNYYPNINLKEYIVGHGENMSEIPNQSVSVVVCTLVLCSVESIEEVLKEVIRVLKPGGRFYYMDHVKGNNWTLRFQYIFSPIWYYFFDGCHLTRDIESEIRKAGFKKLQCESFNAQLHPLIRPHFMGYAEI